MRDISCDPQQDRPTQSTLAGASPVRKTRSKTYTDSTLGREKRERKTISEEDATTLLPDQKNEVPSIPYYGRSPGEV